MDRRTQAPLLIRAALAMLDAGIGVCFGLERYREERMRSSEFMKGYHGGRAARPGAATGIAPSVWRFKSARRRAPVASLGRHFDDALHWLRRKLSSGEPPL